jgi:hypothetical protein
MPPSLPPSDWPSRRRHFVYVGGGRRGLGTGTIVGLTVSRGRSGVGSSVEYWRATRRAPERALFATVVCAVLHEDREEGSGLESMRR